jgi:hypothetical protein
MALALPAAAQTTAVYGGAPDHIDIAVPVTTSIAGRCGFSSAPSGTYDAGDLTQGFAHDFPFAAACNTPFRVAVVSQNGGLNAAAVAPPGYSASAPYEVTLMLIGDAGVVPSNATCLADALASATAVPCSFRGPATPYQGLKLNGPSSGVTGSYLRVFAPAYRGATMLLASSNYRDVLTVSISAAP